MLVVPKQVIFMKIEVDTNNDSKEDLRHLAEMLQKLSGSSAVTSSKPVNIFDDSAPSSSPSSGGLFNMFNDEPSTPASTPEPAPVSSMMSDPSPAPAQNEPAQGGIFSIFGDDPKPAAPSEPAASPSPSMAVSSSAAEPTVADLLSGNAQMPEEEPIEEGKTSVKDVLDDDRIVPY